MPWGTARRLLSLEKCDSKKVVANGKWHWVKRTIFAGSEKAVCLYYAHTLFCADKMIGQIQQDSKRIKKANHQPFKSLAKVDDDHRINYTSKRSTKQNQETSIFRTLGWDKAKTNQTDKLSRNWHKQGLYWAGTNLKNNSHAAISAISRRTNEQLLKLQKFLGTRSAQTSKTAQQASKRRNSLYLQEFRIIVIRYLAIVCCIVCCAACCTEIKLEFQCPAPFSASEQS